MDPPRPGLAGAALGRSGTAGTAQALLPPFRGREGRGRDGLPGQREGVGFPLGSGGRSRHGIVPPRGEFFVSFFFGGGGKGEGGVVALLAFVGFSSGWFGSLGLLGRVERPPCLFLCVCFRVVPLFQPNLTSLPLPPSVPRPYAALPPGQSRPGPQDAAPRDRPRRPAGSHHRGGRDSRAPPPAPLVVVALLGGLLGRRGDRGCCRRWWCRRRQEADRSGWVGRIGHHLLLRQARQGGRSPGARLRRRRCLLRAPPPSRGHGCGPLLLPPSHLPGGNVRGRDSSRTRTWTWTGATSLPAGEGQGQPQGARRTCLPRLLLRRWWWRRTRTRNPPYRSARRDRQQPLPRSLPQQDCVGPGKGQGRSQGRSQARQLRRGGHPGGIIYIGGRQPPRSQAGGWGGGGGGGGLLYFRWERCPRREAGPGGGSRRAAAPVKSLPGEDLFLGGGGRLRPPTLGLEWQGGTARLSFPCRTRHRCS